MIDRRTYTSILNKWDITKHQLVLLDPRMNINESLSRQRSRQRPEALREKKKRPTVPMNSYTASELGKGSECGKIAHDISAKEKAQIQNQQPSQNDKNTHYSNGSLISGGRTTSLGLGVRRNMLIAPTLHERTTRQWIPRTTSWPISTRVPVILRARRYRQWYNN